MDEVGMPAYDENNNTRPEINAHNKTTAFVERHLELNQEDFLIIPNGGSGDCMFKAVSQAVHGDESKHKEVRSKVVDFIINQRWDKFSESIEVQHISGNNLLQRQWGRNPKHTYKMYMNLAGTLGSSSELTAAGELYRYNFCTIQEYCSSTGRTYRVENCLLFHSSQADFHHFYFTGDYDNGHWEFMQSLSNVKIEDGTYQGHQRILINGEETNVEDWFGRETENSNDADHLKIPIDRSLSSARRFYEHPFGIPCFKYAPDGSVTLKRISFSVAKVRSTDLFSVLAQECLQAEESAEETELILMKHRYSYFEEVNYKLITQPWSHNFTTNALKYSGYPCKGNIQDLVSAADLYSFSFILFMKLDESEEDDDGEDVHECKFTHVDRWGGESDRILYFFMRLTQSGVGGQVLGNWWRLIPVDQTSRGSLQTSEASIPQSSLSHIRSTRHPQQSLHRDSVHQSPVRRKKEVSVTQLYSNEPGLRYPRSQSAVSGVESVGYQNPPADPMTFNSPLLPSKRSSRISTPRYRSSSPLHSKEQIAQHRMVQIVEVAEEPQSGTRPSSQKSSVGTENEVAVNLISFEDSGMKTDDGLKKDCDKIFGTRTLSPRSSVVLEKQALLQGNESRLVKHKLLRNDKIKPARDLDLVKRPERVRTVVKIRESGNAGRELVYSGSGYIDADTVLADLGSQGLIRISKTPTSSRCQQNSKYSSQEHFANYPIHSIAQRDENFNLVLHENAPDKPRVDDDQESHISYENFGPGAYRNSIQPQSRVSDDPMLHASDCATRVKPVQNVQRKINKVAPNPREAEPKRQIRPSSPVNSVCLPIKSHLARFISWLSNEIRKISRNTKKGILKRYERYHKSTSLYKLSKYPVYNNNIQKMDAQHSEKTSDRCMT